MPTVEVAAAAVEARGDDRVPEFDGLRGVLAWIVVMVHVLICCGWFGPQLHGHSLLTEFAESTLNIYILLSGFAITRLLMVKREPFKRYLWRRTCRIVPAYWVALAAAIALNGWLAANLRRLPPTPDAQGLAMICDLAAARFWIDSTLHVLLLHGLAPVHWLPFAPYTFLGVAWSLSLEWQFYCIAPFVLAFVKRSRVGLVAVAVIAAAGLGLAGYWLSFFSQGFLLIKGGFILAGAMTYVLAVRGRRSRQPSLAVLGLPAAVATLLWAYGSGRTIEAAITLTVWLTVIAAGLRQRLSGVREFLNSGPLQYLGRVSYSTYLFHVPVITIAQAAIWRWINPHQQLHLFLWTICSAVFATAAVSELSWRYIERPFQTIGRRLPF